MIEIVWQFMNNSGFLLDSANWILDNIFFSLSEKLINWYFLCKATPWPIIPLDIIGSLVLVCILLYILWVGGGFLTLFGVLPGICMIWLLLWLFYYFAIPVYGALAITELIRLPKRWQKILVLIGTIIYFAVIKSHFDYQLAAWYGIMSIFYIIVLLEVKPYKPITKTSP